MITLYAKKEPTIDPVSIHHGVKEMDTVLYRDTAHTDEKARIPWHHSNCPDRRYKYVMLNCYRWRISWTNTTETR